MNISIVQRSKGQSAPRLAAYNARAKIRDERTGEIHDLRYKKGLLFEEILAPQNAQEWAKNRHKLWNRAEAAENRKDAQIARNIVVGLQSELSHDQHRQIVNAWLEENFISKGYVADVCYHRSKNPHAHIMVTMRPLEGGRFGNKSRDMNLKYRLYQWRKSWEHHTNLALQDQGKVISMDSYRRRGVDRKPEIHMGAKALHKEAKGEKTRIGDKNRERQLYNATAAIHERMEGHSPGIPFIVRRTKLELQSKKPRMRLALAVTMSGIYTRVERYDPLQREGDRER